MTDRSPTASESPGSATGGQSPTERGSIVVREAKPADTRERPFSRRTYKAFVGWLAVTGIALIRMMGPALAMKLGRLGGIAGWHLRRADRRIALENLAIAFPEKSEAERRRIARESFARVGQCAMEWFAVSRNPDYAKRVILEGREHVEAARAKRNGVVWINGHVGNWELTAVATQLAGYPCAVIATVVRYEKVNALTIGERARYGITTIQRETPSAGRDLLKAFRRNDMIGILMDHDSKRIPCVQVEFFGRPAWTAIGVAELCIRLGAPAVSGFFRRDADGTMRFRAAPPIFPPENVPKADQLRAARDLTQQFTKRIEEHVRRFPEDWAWMHRRWRA